MSNVETNPAPEPVPSRSPPAIVPLMLAGLFMVVGICALLLIGREKARIIGQTVTELDIQPLLNTDKPISEEDMRSKVVVLHFWGFWCKDCAIEFPDFARVQKQFSSDTDVLFVSIACSDRSDDTRDSLGFYTNKFLASTDVANLPVYWDPAEFSRTRISQLLTAGGFSYPTTLVLDPSGKVVDIWRSGIPAGALEKAIAKGKKSSGS